MVSPSVMGNLSYSAVDGRTLPSLGSHEPLRVILQETFGLPKMAPGGLFSHDGTATCTSYPYPEPKILITKVNLVSWWVLKEFFILCIYYIVSENSCNWAQSINTVSISVYCISSPSSILKLSLFCCQITSMYMPFFHI